MSDRHQPNPTLPLRSDRVPEPAGIRKRPVSAAEPRVVPQAARNLQTVLRSGAAPADRYEVELLEGAVALRELQAPWQELAASASEPNPFYEPWYALPALEQLRERVVAVAVWGVSGPARSPVATRRLDGLFCFECPRVVPGLRYLRSWLHRFAYLGAPLVRAGVEGEVLRAFLDWLPSSGRLPLVRFELLPVGGPLHHALVDELWGRRWPIILADACTRALFRPCASAEQFLTAAVRPKKRKELRRQLNRLGELGTLEVAELCDPGRLDEWLDDFLALEAAGWKGRRGVAVAYRPEDARFFREMARAAFAGGRLMLLSLQLNGRPIAMKLNLLGGEGSFAVMITYDESLARFSPGVQLELENIQRLHQRADIRWMDSCASPNRQLVNQLWPERRELQSLIVTADTPFAAGVAAGLPAVRWVRRWVLGQRDEWRRDDAPDAD